MKTNLQLLIERVREIDWYAAKFLEDNSTNIDDDCEMLLDCFEWKATPQRHAYWQELAEKLGEL